MQYYTLGFAFDDLGRVALIEKQKPDWQKGKWNGIGGKFERGESDAQCMYREFLEETGVAILPEKWTAFGTIRGADCYVYLFTTAEKAVRDVATLEDEQVMLFSTSEVYSTGGHAIPNVPMLLEAARWKLTFPKAGIITLHEESGCYS